MRPACAITTARTVKPRVVTAKIIDVDEDGMITGVEPSPQGFLFEFREVQVQDLARISHTGWVHRGSGWAKVVLPE